MTQTGERGARKRVLAVDDAATILLRITDTLEKYYDVVTVNSGPRALRYLEKVRPDLILLDIRMTPKNGFDTLREIRDMPGRADIPVIMLTAMEDKNSVLEGITLGISDYVLKPFSPSDLLSRIRRVLGDKDPRLPGQGGEGAGG
ncbi:MAG: response regulator [Oscillospiraceae bacterium]|nr:response regulator [Oscillospiraceae bacterium]MCI8807573.1 response regulator [Oscillospiraceae bacterium]MCI9308599.1 response regulator [Oscillospiraceae bacterium]MCI9549724.1 response regulator [Oscillospiraceae bacterium]